MSTLVKWRNWETGAYSSLPRVGHVAIRFKKRSDIEGLPPPNGAMHRPIEGKLQCPAVEGPELGG